MRSSPYPKGLRAVATATALVFALSPVAGGQTPAAPASAAVPPTAAPAPGQKTFSQQELDQLLAPVALYPDSLLVQVLMAATYPLDVVQAERWVKANPKLKDKALEDALQSQPWDPAVKSLAVFPQVLTMMSEKVDWTQKLGDAFLAQKEDVMATAQALRGKAVAQGTLKDSNEQKVVTEKVESTTIIKIEPTNPEVVYVPTYNPTVVYGGWPYPAYPPYYYYPPGYVAGGALLGFTAGVIVGGALWGGANWGRGDVNIDVNRYNNFNKTNISNREFQHNGDRRGGVPYRDGNTAQKYNRGQSGNAQARDGYRGRTDGAGGARADGAGGARGDGAGGARSNARAGDTGRTGGMAETRGGGGGFDSGARGSSSAFDSGSRSATRDASSRGTSSMSSARSSGGGARAGGGGGGGRGGGGGGGRGGRR